MPLSENVRANIFFIPATIKNKKASAGIFRRQPAPKAVFLRQKQENSYFYEKKSWKSLQH